MRSTVVSMFVACVLIAAVPPAAAQFASPIHIIPVIAKVKGNQGTDWKSDGSFSNLSGSTVTVNLQFFREAQSNTFIGIFSQSITLAPGETRTVEDILGTYFPGEGNTKGMLLVMAADVGGSSPLLAVTTRTYNAADPSATYGQTVPSNLLATFYGVGRSVLPGVSSNGRVRTNIGVCNLGPVSANVVIVIYNAAGGIVQTVTRTVEAFSLRQWSLADLGVPSLTGGRAEVHLHSSTPGFDPCDDGSAPFLSSLLMAYFSKVDNATGDAEFGFGQLVWAVYEDTCGNDPGDDCSSAGAAERIGNALGLPLQ